MVYRLRQGVLDLNPVRALAHTPAFCRSRIRLRSWSFSHVPALPLPAVGFIQTEVFKTVVWHRQIQIRVQVATQYIETHKPHEEDVCAASGLSSSSPARKFAGPATRPDRLRVKAPIFIYIASGDGVGPDSGFAGVCANALRVRRPRSVP